MNNITIFTADLENNKGLETPLHKFCLNSWHRLIPKFKEIGVNATIKIFGPSSTEVQEFNEITKDLTFSRVSTKADAFRIWMLSRNENYLWLDWDIYIPENFQNNLINFEKGEMFLYKVFCVMFNSNKLEFFNNLFKKYIQDPFCRNNYDQAVFKYLNLSQINCDWNWRAIFFHLSIIDDDFSTKEKKKIEWVKQEDLIKNDIEEFKKNSKTKKIAYFSETQLFSNSNHIIFNCRQDKDLINFIQKQKIIKENCS